MKCTIFWLLAFCAIQTIFANNRKDQNVSGGGNNLDFSNADDTSLEQIVASLFDAQSQLADALKTVKNTPGVQNCFQDAATTIVNHNNAKIDACKQCHSKSVKNNSIQKATKCCDDVIKATKKEAQVDIASGKACMTKCAKPGAVCPKKQA